MNAASRGTTLAGAFTRLLEMLRPDLLRFAYWLARDRQVAEDVEIGRASCRERVL